MVHWRFLSHSAYGSRIARGGCILLLATFLLAGCASSAPTTSNASATGTRGVAPSPTTGIAQAASTVVAGVTPVMTPLGPPPTSCALAFPPQQMHLDHLGDNSHVELLGGGVFWFYGMFYQSVLHLGQFGFDKRWPMTKWVVEVGPNYSQPVTLRLRNLETNELAWWTNAQSPPQAATQVLVLNSQTNGGDVGSVAGIPDVPHGQASPGWSEWGLFPIFPKAGCYRLEVSWASGSWQSTMAVGN